MAEREIEPSRNRALALLHELARDVVDRRDMVGIDRMAQSEAIGQKCGTEQHRVVAEGEERPCPSRHVSDSEHAVDADDLADQIGTAIAEDPLEPPKHARPPAPDSSCPAPCGSESACGPAISGAFVNRGTSPRRKARSCRQARLDPHRSDPPDVPARDHGRWQVSWLAAPRRAPPSRLPSGSLALGSPPTVAGAATVLRRRRAPCSLSIPEGNHRRNDRQRTGSRSIVSPSLTDTEDRP